MGSFTALASAFAEIILRPRFELWKVGRGTRIRAWRIRPQLENKLQVGEMSNVAASIRFERPGAEVKIGDRTFIGKSLIIAASRVDIGSDVLISWGVTIADHDSHSIVLAQRKKDALSWMQGKKDWTHVASEAVVLNDGCWIGFNVIILPGVTIGRGAVVGAGSVVTRDVPPWSLAAGNPARIVKELPVDD